MQYNIEQFIQSLEQRLRDALPGSEAHYLLEPPTRKYFPHEPRRNARHSSVLILIYPQNDKLYTITILRPQYNGVHSGQISFPGGQYEEGDEQLLYTALRETQEEIGVEVSTDQVIGRLSDIYIPPSNFIVTPFVAVIQQVPIMKKDSFEVEKLIEVNLEDILHPDSIVRKNLNLEKYGNVHVPCFIVDDQIIWGATAMIMSELRTILGEIL